jgi:RNA polymerase sigma factor (sigma-70 family)
MSPRIRAWVCTFSRRYDLGRPEADDLYSDVALRILKSTRAYDPALGNASCYLYGLTRHAVFDFLKNKTRHRAKLLGGVDPGAPRPAEKELPEEVLVLRRELARLDARDRNVVLMRVEEERSLKQIASALKMTVPQTRMCYRQTVARLRRTLACIPSRHGLSRRKRPLRRGRSIDG